MENELRIRLKQMMYEAYMGELKAPGSEATEKISNLFGEISKNIGNNEVQASIFALAENSFMEGYKLGLSVSPSELTRPGLSFDRIIYRMRDKGFEPEEISEYMGISKEQVKKVLRQHRTMPPINSHKSS